MIRISADNVPARALRLLQEAGVRVPRLSPELNLMGQMGLWNARLDRFFVQVIHYLLSVPVIKIH